MRDDDDQRGYEHEDRPLRKSKSGVPAWAWVLIGVGAMGLLSCCGVGGIFLTGVFKGVKEGPIKYTPMTADELTDEWAKNPQNAAAKYRDSGVELKGKLQKIDSNVAGQTYIQLRGFSDDWKRESHIFVHSQQAKDGLGKCTVGKQIVVRARAEGSAQDRPWLIADEILPAD